MNPGSFYMLCYYYPPANNGAVRRNLALAGGLQRLGWDVTVVTAWPGPDAAGPEPERGPGGERVVRAVDPRFRWFPPPSPQANDSAPAPGGLGRFMPQRFKDLVWDYCMVPDEARFWFSAARAALADAMRGDRDPVLMTCSGPETAHLIGASLKEAARRRGRELFWVADFADGWCWETLKRALQRVPYRRSLEARLEGRCVRSADLVTGTVPALLDDLGRRHRLDEDRRLLVSNGYDGAAVRAVAPRDKPAGTFRIAYTGRLSLSDRQVRIEPFVEGLLRAVEADPEFAAALETVWMGEFAPEEHAQFERLKERVGCVIEPIRPWHESVALQKSADVLLLVISGARPATETTKLPEYLSTGGSVLVLAEPGAAAAELVTRSGAGVAADPRDPAGIAEALRRLWEARHHSPAADVDEPIASHYDFARITERLSRKVLELRER